MSAIDYYKSYKVYKDDYIAWRNNRDTLETKRKIYLQKHPELITEKNIQKSKTLLRVVDLMDELTYKKNQNFEAVSSSIINTGLEYSAIGGTALGFLLSKTQGIKRFFRYLSKNNDKTLKFLNVSLTTLSGVIATMLAFPIYNWASKAESKAYRRNRHEVMRNDLNDPKIFATLTVEQEKILNENLKNFEKNKNFAVLPFKTIGEKIKDIQYFSKENFIYRKDKLDFEKELFSDRNFYNENLTKEEIEIAKEEQQILTKLVDKINIMSQEYQEKAEIITTSLITGGFALGSLFALTYERIMKKLKLKSSSLPANLGMFLMIALSFIGISLNKKASHIGRFKAKQELMNNPEQLIYISDEKTGEIKDIEIHNKNLTTKDFIINIWKDKRDYEHWKKETFAKEKNLAKSYSDINLTPDQITEAKRLQRNVFKTFSRMDDNTQKHAESIAILGQAIQYPLTLALNTFAGLYGLKHLDRLVKSTTKSDVFINSLKYIGTILAFTLPTILINNRIIKEEKEAKQISDMITLKNMEDYKKFADYSRFKITE